MFDWYKAPPPLSVPELEGRANMEWIIGGLLVVAALVAIWLTLGPLWLWDAVRASLYGFGHAIPWLGPKLFPTAAAPAFPPLHRLAVPSRPTTGRVTRVLWGPWLLGWLRAMGMIVVLGAVAMVVSRVIQRRRRAATQLWYEVGLFQHDVAEPDQVRAMYNAVWNALIPRSRWFGAWFLYRWFAGTDALTLAVLRDYGADKGEYLHILLGAPHRSLGRVLQIVQNTYQNVRFTPWLHPVPSAWPQMVRWGLRSRSPLHLVTLTSNYDAMPMEALIQGMAREAWKGETPPPFIMTWNMRAVPSSHLERQIAQAAQYAQWTSDIADQAAARSANTQLGHGLFRVEWRAGVASYDQAQRLVGTLGIHNNRATLMPHNILVWRQAIGRWVAEGLPSVFPMAHGFRMWSGELATFGAFPTGRLRVSELVRYNTRRMPASRALSRDPGTALVEAEGHDQVGLYWNDLTKNLLLLGIQGSGKSTHVLNLFANAVAMRDPDGRPAAPVILFDIGKDTAPSALRLCPPDREVLYVAPGDDENPWGLPLLSGGTSSLAQVNHVIEIMMDVFGEDSIGPRSRQALQHLIATVIAAGTPEHPPSLDTAYQMMVSEKIRLQTIAQAKLNGRLDDHTDQYWSSEFEKALERNPAFMEEVLAAPRNKLHEFLRSRQLRAVLGAPDPFGYVKRAVDWDRVIQERQVVILDLSVKDLGAATVRLLGIVATLNLWHAIERQGRLREEDRVPVYTLYDEAQRYLSPSFLNILAEGRAYGWRTAIATRFMDELDEKIRDGVEDLCQNLIIHRIPLVEEANRLMKRGMTIFMNNITLQEEAQAIERMMADDIMKLPDRQAICMWQANGNPEPPFFAATIDWRPLAHEDWAQYHLSQQPRIEPRRVTPPPPVFPEERVPTPAELAGRQAPAKPTAANSQISMFDEEAPAVPAAAAEDLAGPTDRAEEIGVAEAAPPPEPPPEVGEMPDDGLCWEESGPPEDPASSAPPPLPSAPAVPAVEEDPLPPPASGPVSLPPDPPGPPQCTGPATAPVERPPAGSPAPMAPRVADAVAEAAPVSDGAVLVTWEAVAKEYGVPATPIQRGSEKFGLTPEHAAVLLAKARRAGEIPGVLSGIRPWWEELVKAAAHGPSEGGSDA